VRAGLIDVDEAAGGDRLDGLDERLPVRDDRGPVALCRDQRLFFRVNPSRCKARPIVATPTRCPVALA
jgi:hypothetical protein